MAIESITAIRIENYITFQDSTFCKLGKGNIFFGSNGSGKSSLLYSLRLLENDNIVVTEDDFYQKDTTKPIKITVSFENNKYQISKIISYDKTTRTIARKLEFSGKDEAPLSFKTIFIPPSIDYGFASSQSTTRYAWLDGLLSPSEEMELSEGFYLKNKRSLVPVTQENYLRVGHAEIKMNLLKFLIKKLKTEPFQSQQYLVLLDEPDTHIHQSNLFYLKSIMTELASLNNVQIFTTAIDGDLSLIEGYDTYSLTKYKIGKENSQIYSPLNFDNKEKAILWKSPSNRFAIGSNRTILVEGQSDKFFLERLLEIFEIEPEKQPYIFFVGGFGELKDQASLLEKFGVKTLWLADADYTPAFSLKKEINKTKIKIGEKLTYSDIWNEDFLWMSKEKEFALFYYSLEGFLRKVYPEYEHDFTKGDIALQKPFEHEVFIEKLVQNSKVKELVDWMVN